MVESLPRRGPWIALLSILVVAALPLLVWPRISSLRARQAASEAVTRKRELPNGVSCVA